MRKSVLVVIFLIIWITLTITALSWGLTFNWPDYVHVNFGVPLVWAIHTLSTIAGPADEWVVDLSALIINLIFWLGSMIIIAFLILHFKKS